MTDRETDSFIQEVTEEVRKDRMFTLWKKWGPIVIGTIVVLVGGAAYWSWTEAQNRAEAEARGATFVAADPQAPDAVAQLPDRIDGPAQVVAELAAAAALARSGRIDQAVTLYEGIAAQDGLAAEYADFASLRAAALLRNRTLLAPLTEADRPYRLLALELRAALRLEAGETDDAHADLRAILSDPTATGGQRQRAQAILAATGGDVADAAG